MIWKQSAKPEDLNKLSIGCAVEHLGIELTAINEDSIEATMPVDHRTTQPFGLLHGGASALLAETLGSIAGHLAVEQGYFCVGQSIHAHHVRSVKAGVVTATAKPVYLGGRSHVWHIDIVDEAGQLVCHALLNLAVLKQKAT